MLSQLIVKDFALSQKNTLEFKRGMTSITGETGAGKSLTVDALSLILGARADSSMVKSGCERAELNAVFDVSASEKTLNCLKEHDLFTDDGTLVIRRVITSDGKSKAYVNDNPCTLALLKELTEELVSIHGQHASVKLIDRNNQLSLLDSFARLNAKASKVAAAYDSYNIKRRELQTLADEQMSYAQNYKNLRYELDELTKLDLKEGDYEQISLDFDALSHLNQAHDAVALAQASLENDEHNLIDILSARINDLSRVSVYAKESIDPIIKDLSDAATLLDSAREKLDNFTLEANPSKADELSERLSLCHDLARRFEIQPKDVYKERERLEKEMQYFLSLKEKIATLTAEVKKLREEYEKEADELSKLRAEASVSMSEDVTASIRELAMPDGIFKVEVTRNEECRPRREGRDEVTFLFTANIGEEPKELGSVASGGELSRLALAIEVLTSSANSTETLIFDEVDTGISGRTASSVGQLLRRLGKSVQVITVTHLPQVAAAANHQFLVYKEQDGQNAVSHVKELDENGRIDEIARMMGGNVVTNDTLSSARTLIAKSGEI
ncbi:MAG: DNA repair protein RecN [Succinivibrio sp.]